MADNVYLDEGDVQVTDSHLALLGQTISMERIKAVHQSKQEQLGCLPNGLMGIGLLVILASLIQGIEAAIAGVVMIAGGVVWYRRLKPTYYVLLTTVDGKMRALDTKDKDRVYRVYTALQKALANN